MKSKFVTDLQDPFESFLSSAEAEVFTNFFPQEAHHLPALAGRDGGKPPDQGPVEFTGVPALTGEAAVSSSAQSGAITALAMTTGGITINLLFDAAAMAAPASFRAGIQQAASLLTAAISDQITVNIKIDYSGTGGGAAAGPDAGFYESYSSVRANLINNATPGDASFNALSSGSSVQGQSSVAVWNAQLKLWGVIGANDTTTDDGSATFATDINPNLLVGVALHELTHAMGRVPYGSAPDIFDLFRFTGAGTMLFSGSSTAPAAYFSVNGGTTKLADYGRTSDPSDFLNSGVQGSGDPFNEFYGGGTIQALTAADKAQMDALGFHLAVVNPPPVVTPSNLQEVAGEAPVALSSHLAYSDPGNLPAVTWHIQDIASDGSSALLLNGSPISAAQSVSFTAAQFAQLSIGLVTSSHDIWANANDGISTSAPVHFTVSPPASAGPPVVTPSNLQEVAGEAPVALSSHLGYSDPGNLPAVTWHIQDVSSDGSSALLLNGSPFSAAQSATLTAAQFAQLSIGLVTSSHDIWANANDGISTSAPVHFTVSPPSPPANAGPPVVTPSNLQEVAGEAPVALSSHLGYSDPGNLPAVTWHVQDVASDGSSALLLNGSPFSAAQSATLTAAQFAQLSIGLVTSAHDIWANASDGISTSAPVHFTVSPPASAGPPVVTPSNLQEVAGEAPVALSSHLGYSDPGNLPAVTWHIQDVASDGSSALLLNGSPFSAAQSATLTAAQFAQLSIGLVTSSHDIWANTSDGTYTSAPVYFTVSPPVSAGPPVVTPLNLQEVAGEAPVALSSHLGYSDPGNLPAVTWHIQDVASDGSSALLLNGSPFSAAQSMTLTSAQFAQLSIGLVTSSHDIWANANDGTYTSAPVHFTVSPPAALVAVTANQSEQAVQDNVENLPGNGFFSGAAHHDTFVFAADFGKNTSPAMDPAQFDHAVAAFAWETGHGNPLFTAGTGDLSPLHDAAADVLHHLSDFHIV
jgi:hypothetical protein